jgi:4-amino-4-deoxy-L-arabinose transferase-like glycosyltransferase
MLAIGFIGAGNAGVMAFVTPPLQVIDEPTHVGYVEYIAATGKVPHHNPARLPPFGLIPTDLHVEKITTDARPASISPDRYVRQTWDFSLVEEGLPFSFFGQPSWDTHDAQQLSSALRVARRGPTQQEVDTASQYMPLYYLYEAVPALAGRHMNAIDRLYAMRVWSGLLVGLTACLVYLFIREVLPRYKWAGPIGALAVAFQPMVAFYGGGVNNDAGLYAASAGLLLLLARSFRRGLTGKRGAAIGAVLGAGFLVKSTMIVFAPGVALAMLAITLRDRRRRHEGLAGIGWGSATFAALVGAFVAAGTFLYGRSIAAAAGVESGMGSVRLSPQGYFSYLWQYFLPRLPSMRRPPWPGYVGYGVWTQYVQGFIGRFGWWQYGFSRTGYFIGLAVLLVVAGLAVLGLIRVWPISSNRAVELACYAVIGLTFLLVLAYFGYRYLAWSTQPFEETRYLFPLLALYGAVVALAARGAGARWGRAVGSCFVVLAFGHYLLAVLLTVQRYYA